MAEFCTHCGAGRIAGNRFCAQCGKAFAGPGAPAAAPVPPASPYVPPASPYVPPASPYVPPPVPFQSQPASRGSDGEATSDRQPLLIGGVAVAAVVVAVMAWWSFSDIQVNGIQPKPSSVKDKASAATATPAETAEVPYVDTYLSPTDEPMMTRGPVALLPLPGQSAGTPLRSMPENAPLTGRWVRGADGTSRWFRVNGGGYLPEAAVVAARAVPPVVRPFDMSAFNSPLNSYVAAANREHQRAMELAEKKGGDEVAASGFAAVPARPMFGITVTGVGSHWEASTVIFRENFSTVAAALRRAGWQVGRDGDINVGPDVGESCSISSTSRWPEFAAYGATVLSCGV